MTIHESGTMGRRLRRTHMFCLSYNTALNSDTTLAHALLYVVLLPIGAMAWGMGSYFWERPGRKCLKKKQVPPLMSQQRIPNMPEPVNPVSII